MTKTEQLGFKSYEEYLKSDIWKTNRDRFLNTIENKCCVVCLSTIKINVHHRTYKNLGDEKINDLVILCQSCHRKFHAKKIKKKKNNIHLLKTKSDRKLNKKINRTLQSFCSSVASSIWKYYGIKVGEHTDEYKKIIFNYFMKDGITYSKYKRKRLVRLKFHQIASEIKNLRI
ncbi:MAG: HNH endonuclease signature motif containing protein [Actinomycetota bacterium]